ncbi:MAG: hypothetical protein ACRCTZ_18760 [Sarcina sp.]
MNKPLVIAIAAVSGGGKTTLVRTLENELDLSKALYFDEYDFDEAPTDFFEWVKSGSNYNEWNLYNLVNDIENLLGKNNLEYILLDYPFAYKNDQIAQYIDYAIFIDTPLDIAMARRILRDKLNESPELLTDNLVSYVTRERIAYLEMVNTIKPNSDFIIDGTLSKDNIKNQVIKELKRG